MYLVIITFLGLILASACFGLASHTVKEAGQPFVDFFVSSLEVVLQVLKWFLWYVPQNSLKKITLYVLFISKF